MSEAAVASPGRKIRQFDVRVADIIVETPDTVTLVFDGAGPFEYKAGQFCTIDPHQFRVCAGTTRFLEDLKKHKEPPRAYSMSSAPHEPYVAITIKEEVYDGVMEYPPLISGFLVHQLRAGERISVTGFAGAYVLPEKVNAEHILHLCAGSGSVPNVSIIKDSLRRHPDLRHTFVYSNKTLQDVIFRSALAELQAQHPDRLKVIHTITRESGIASPDEDIRSGRVTLELLREIFDREPTSIVYTCGPAVSVWERRAHAAKGTTPSPRFLETMQAYLTELGIPRDRVKMEAFG